MVPEHEQRQNSTRPTKQGPVSRRKQEPTDKLPNADWLEAGFGPGSGWIARSLPCCRFPLLNQEQIQGPENVSIAQFDGLWRYQSRSEIRNDSGAWAATKQRAPTQTRPGFKAQTRAKGQAAEC